MDQTEIKTIGAEGINPSIVFTDSAAKKVSQLIEEEKNDSLKLRVFISAGVAQGFSTALLSMKQLKPETVKLRIWE